MPEALVNNAADPKQVSEAGKATEIKREDELNDVRTALAVPAVRRYMRRVLGRCKTFESVWAQSALIHYNAGQQDIGHWIMAEITEASPKLMLELMQENMEAENGRSTRRPAG